MTRKRRRWRPPRSDQAGVFAAAGGTAMTFQRTLMPRNNTDQAIVTGATMSLMYLTASLMHDAIEAVASFAITGGSQRQADEDLLRRTALAAGAVAFIGGLGVQRAFPQRSNEPLHKAGARAAGQWLSISAFAGLASGVTEEVVDSLDEHTGRRYHLDLAPIALIGGMTFAGVREFQRRRKERTYAGEQDERVAAVRNPLARHGDRDRGGSHSNALRQPFAVPFPWHGAGQAVAGRPAAMAPVGTRDLSWCPRGRALLSVVQDHKQYRKRNGQDRGRIRRPAAVP